ncbi:MAG TPA: hypothetical protein GX740_00795 [Acholeplasmataceae bacterium]|nr:hypothetical protein [Acholeplasmataceae bacterium]
MAKNKLSYKVIGFWSVIALLTLLFIGFVIAKFIETRNIQTMEDMSNLREQQIFEQQGTYYVYVYSKFGIEGHEQILDKAAELEETIVNYLTYAKRNKEASKLYGMIVDSGSDNYGNYGALVFGTQSTNVRNVTSFSNFKVHVDDLPMLVKISNGRVTDQYLTESAIKEELQKAMGIE